MTKSGVVFLKFIGPVHEGIMIVWGVHHPLLFLSLGLPYVY
jgi:hypothetical protein